MFLKFQEKVNDLREIYKELSNAVGGKNKTLSTLTEDLDEVRRQLEDRGSVMADGGIKKILLFPSDSRISDWAQK